MGERRGRLTLGHSMLAIGVAALVFALTRVEAAPGVSLFVFAACTWYLASRRFAETMARRSACGLTTSRVQKARILAGSASLAVVVIGLPDAAFLAGYYGYMETIRGLSLRPVLSDVYLDVRHLLAGISVGLIAALNVVAIERRWLGSILSKTPKKATTGRRESLRPGPEPEVAGRVDPTDVRLGL